MQAPEPTVRRARSLRGRMTPPEVRLWVQLRRKVQGLRFRRQHPVGPFVLDFYCHGLRLAVEVDGQAHRIGDAPLRDIERDAWLSLRGIRVLRLPAGLVMEVMDAAIWTILAAARQTSHPPHP